MTWEGVSLILGIPLVAAIVVRVVMGVLDVVTAASLGVEMDRNKTYARALGERCITLTEDVEKLKDAQSDPTAALEKVQESLQSLDERLKYVEARPTAHPGAVLPYLGRR